MISVWPKFYSFDSKMILRFHFTFKPFPGHAQKRERERKKEELTEIVQSLDCWDCPPKSSAFAWSRSTLCTITIVIARSIVLIAISPSRQSRSCEAPRRSRSRLRANRDRAKCQDLMIFFWVLFVFLYWDDIIYLFGNRENVRKCEQQVENVFFMVF